MDDDLNGLPAGGLDDPSGLIGGLNFTASSLIAGFIFGIIGLYLFRFGRKNSSLKLTLIGLALMIYPYFTNGPWLDWGIGIGLTAYAYYSWRNDY